MHIRFWEALIKEEQDQQVGRASRLSPQLFYNLASTLPLKSLLSWPPATSLLLNPKFLPYLIWQWPSSLLTSSLSQRLRTLLFSPYLHSCSFSASSCFSHPVSVWVPVALVALIIPLPTSFSWGFDGHLSDGNPKSASHFWALDCCIQFISVHIYLDYSTGNSKLKAYVWVRKSRFCTA